MHLNIEKVNLKGLIDISKIYCKSLKENKFITFNQKEVNKIIEKALEEKRLTKDCIDEINNEDIKKKLNES
jgi:hypothetical protein